MATDHDGTTLEVGDNIWVPATITSKTSLNVTASLALGTGSVTVTATATRKDKPKNFPDGP